MQADDAFCSPSVVEKERANSHLRRNCYVNRRGVGLAISQQNFQEKVVGR